jgi:N,N-dimethylformamidase beta subunit-like protein/concanavalin A-like lectin/glucanase superfamily protein
MATKTRREFIQQTAIGAAGIATLELSTADALADSEKPEIIPPHRALMVLGVHAYADQTSVAAGQTISFQVSSTVRYRLSVCRLGLKMDDPAGDDVLHEFSETQPRVQAIHPGSYVFVKRGIRARLRALTLECWVRPWKLGRKMGLIAQHTAGTQSGFALEIGSSGAVVLCLGISDRDRKRSVRISAAQPLQSQRWHHVVAAWDGRLATLWIDGATANQADLAGTVFPPSLPLRVAGGADPEASDFLDADLAMPVIYNRALMADEIRERFAQQGLVPAEGKGVLACWPLTEERGDRVADVSGNGHHGRIINHATWMIGGPGFQAEVPRFGNYDPAEDPKRGHAIRFASDDLYDCRWEPTHRYRIPANAKPGIYVGRIRFELEGKPQLYHAAFIVRKPKRRKPAPILVLCATNTWKAYSGTPFGKNLPELKQVWGTNGITNNPGDPPAYCFYRGHAAGPGTFQLGFRMPWPVASPYVLYGGPTDYSHLARADRFFHVWLEQSGYDFDVVSDLDLHRDPDMLRDYRVFVINGHSEYWSLPMYRGLEKYLAGHGNVICLSGNSLFWRVSYSDDGSILECRKVDAPGDQLPHERRGECWHSHDGKRGGMLRECGYPGWKLIGLDTLGWNNQGDARQFGPYVVEQPDHFLFNHPEKVSVHAGDAIGQAPNGGLPRANGHEIDVRLSTLAALQEQPPPAGVAMPADPPGMTRLANGIITWKIGGAAFDYFFRPIKPKTDQGGELIYWERLEGGRVFNAGSIGAGWALLADPKFQTLMRNILFHFGAKLR